jgi:alkylation response protein AidB-like acyl-CoA dehydrogenase
MDVRLSPEQQALRQAAAQLVDRVGPRAVADLDDPDRVARLDAAVAGAGWRELRVNAGGAPLASGVEAALVAEELGRGLADTAFLGPLLAAELRRLVGAPAVDELETVLLDAELADVAVAVGDEAPAGTAIDARGAVRALVLVAGTAGAGLAAVPIEAADVQVDLTRPTARPAGGAPLEPVASSGPLGDEERTAWLALALALSCADLVGVMRGALDLARHYAASRRQYDAPIGSFQAVQHLLVDAHVAMEGSRSAALHAAWAVDAVAPAEALAAASVAMAYCGRAARQVCETSVQVHGGIGNTWDCLAHVHLRRALHAAELFGGVGASLERVLAHSGVGPGAGSRGLR